MKKVFIASSMLLALPFMAGAQTTVATTTTPTPVVAPLPDAGFVPGDFLYFLDRLGEGFNYFYTFNSESKARLALQYAQERAAEINALLASKTIDSPEVQSAKSDFDRELGRASVAILDAKNNGSDVSSVAREINSRFEESKDMLKIVLHNRHEDLKAEVDTLRSDLDAAVKSANTSEKTRIEERLKQHSEEMNKLNDVEDSIDNGFAEEKDKLEASMGEQQSAESQITNAKRARIQFVNEATVQGSATSTAATQALAAFDALLKKATDAYSAKDFENAKGYAKDAKQALNDARNEIDTRDVEKDFFEDNEDSSEGGSRKMSPEEFLRQGGAGSPAHIEGREENELE